MSRDILADRGRALEEVFFAKQNDALRKRLRETEETIERKQALSAASGITDERVLEKLVALNFGSATLAAFSLVPLVAVAWADSRIDDSERSAILSAMAEVGLSKQDISYQLVERWLAERPTPELLATWKNYIDALSGSLSPQAKDVVKAELLGRARKVAAAAGGFLGLTHKVSSAENAVLEELERTFS